MEKHKHKHTSSTSASASHGVSVSFTGLLGITFIVLKLCGVIDWPWIWVLCPLWFGAAITILVLIAVIILSIYIGRD